MIHEKRCKVHALASSFFLVSKHRRIRCGDKLAVKVFRNW